MATDFDFDGSFDDSKDEATTEEFIEEEEEEEDGRRPNRLRFILLLLFLIVLVCVCAFVLPSRLGLSTDTLFPDPGAADPVAGTDPTAEPTDPATTAENDPAPTEETDPVATEEPASDATDEAMAEPTDEADSVPTEETDPVATEEPAPDATEEAVEEPDEEEPVVIVDPEPTDEPTADPTEEPATDPAEDPTTDPEADPTDEPETSPTTCDNNTAPAAAFSADPSPAMIGKGQAVVAVDASASTDADGNITRYAWNFGDGSDDQVSEQATTTHGYKTPGTYIITLTVMDDCGATNDATSEVTIVPAATPTPDGDDSNDDPATDTPDSEDPSMLGNVTMGVCYKVQRGDTLSGIAWNNGVTLYDLARVNNVTTEYFVIAGQGLFIPTGTIQAGANGYQVQAGDTLNSIAYNCGVTVSHLAQVNNLSLNATLTAGNVLIIPIGVR